MLLILLRETHKDGLCSTSGLIRLRTREIKKKHRNMDQQETVDHK